MKPMSLVMPQAVVLDESTATREYGRFTIEPLERGYGTTLGNALRRVLLSSIEGAAVRAVTIEGELHEFTAIPGVREDVTDIVLNLKGLIVKVHDEGPVTLRLDVPTPKVVTGEDIQKNPHAEVLNRDHYLATVEKGGRLTLEMVVVKGHGYVPSNAEDLPDKAFNTIPMDSAFSPIRRVKYLVEDTRVGQITDYDRLVLEIWTNGTIEPREALEHAGLILHEHIQLFVGENGDPDAIRVPEISGISEQAAARAAATGLNPNLFRSIEELELSVRSYNCLKAANLKVIGELVQKTEAEMLKYRNFGKKSLDELKELLDTMGLSFGMTFDDPSVFERHE